MYRFRRELIKILFMTDLMIMSLDISPQSFNSQNDYIFIIEVVI